MWWGRSPCAVLRNQTSEGSSHAARDRRAGGKVSRRGRVISRADNRDPNNNHRADNLARHREEDLSREVKGDLMAGLKAGKTEDPRVDKEEEEDDREARHRKGREGRDRKDRNKGNKSVLFRIKTH